MNPLIFGNSLKFPVLLAVLTGCATTLPPPAVERPVEPLPAALGDAFCYPAAALAAHVELVEEKKRFSFYKGSFESGIPADADPAPITFEWYQPSDVDRAPVAIVLPILNGQKHIVRPFATYFTKHGYASIIVDSRQRSTLTEDILDPQAAIRQAVRRHRRVLDWVDSEPTLDGDRVVVFGASLGGFNAFFLSAFDDRVRGVAPALVAADLAHVFANSNERRIEEAFAVAMEKLDIDRDALEGRMRRMIETDTTTVSPHLDANRILMVQAKRDKAVPFAKQQELWQLLGEPEVVVLPTGHVTSAAYIFYLRKRVLRFFDRVLAEPDGSVAAISPASCLGSRSPPIMSDTRGAPATASGE